MIRMTDINIQNFVKELWRDRSEIDEPFHMS